MAPTAIEGGIKSTTLKDGLVSELWNLTTGISGDIVTDRPRDVTSVYVDNTDTVTWTIVCSVCFIFGLSIASAVYFWDRRNLPENIRKRKIRKISEKKKKEEKAIAAIKKEPIQVDQFLQKLRQKKLDKYLNFEVRAIVRNQEDYSCLIATQPDNARRNICQDVISYDHSLVTLKKIPPRDDSTYINASYIEGYNNQIEYIATQGPRGKQVAAFWHMVWQENVHVVVMATGLFENAAQQCDKYWGDILSVQKYVRHGDIHIYLKDKLELSKLTVRTFQICEDGCDEPRTLKHFEMTGFSDDSTDPGFLLDVWRRVNRTMLTVPGPMLVHCRCGGGRTASFIAVDYCLKQLDREHFVDIYSTVLHLRKFRKNMVRSLSQYRLIYDTLAMYVQVWNTVIPSAKLPAVAHKLMLKDPQTDLIGFEKEFQFLQDIVPKIPIGDCASGHRDENRNKSRDIMLLPPERARPYLQTIETNESGTDFINAVFVDGYHSDNSFIVTQWPMQSTMNDIWRLLFDFKINTFVVLHENKFNRSTQCFWPKVLDEEVKYGPIGVKYLGCQKYPHIIIRAFAIRKKASSLPLIDLLTQNTDSVVVKMFQYTSWHQRDKIPTSTKSFLYMMGCVDEWQKNTNSQSPICVMSKDGYSKCGLYCTLNICCDQIHCEKEVDIFNAVRVVKKNRPQLIPTQAEYIYCYSYMSLVVHLMLEESPKLLLTSPTVIEGEIQQGYELLTGFENILCPQPSEEVNKNGTSLKNLNHTSAFSAGLQTDSKDSSCDALNTQGLDSQTLLGGEKVNESGHRKSSGIMTDNANGHIHKNGRMHMQKEENVTAPAAPGHIHVWDPETIAHFNEPASAELKMPRRQSTKRRPFYRQNAQEMNEIRAVDYTKSFDMDILESSYL
ncbi:receptor-type tyrosine-protein phosphatase kappa-like isoform X2 [Ruditapes philippinarum]|uniref:receptor-type tyrosine-protein phosphatase kappa-like isoform X2 n=1 Tax=Ruditapes philippinarum TaxID=129788 RepID=UPI00295ACBE7|nr:receptor-type tyrosine-protein phosphatase kappa-like isoform X2 [Ruditapes philippinarum]